MSMSASQPFGVLAPRPNYLADETAVNASAAENWEIGFGVLSFRGKQFHVRQRGREVSLFTPPNFRTPLQRLALVIVGVARAKSKVFYAGVFNEDQRSRPDCRSLNGIVPDADVVNKQNDLCATCEQNQWGSGSTAQRQTRAKACRDFKRVAVVPWQDVYDQTGQPVQLDGPLLLNVPPTSVGNLLQYTGFLTKNGAGYHQLITTVACEAPGASPTLTFEHENWLSADDAVGAREMMQSVEVRRMLEFEWGPDSAEPGTLPASMRAVVAQLPARPAAVPAPVAQAAPPPPVPPAPAPAPAPVQAAPVAPVPPKVSPFRRATAQAVPVAAPVAQQAPPREPAPEPEPTPEPEPEPTPDTPPPAAATPVSVVQGPPPDLQSALNNLLAGD